jgi:outer membrane protein assembly factor BamB
VTAVQPRVVISGRSAARQKGSVVRVASIPAMIGPMRLRGPGASRPTALAGSLSRGARNAFVVGVLALAGCAGGEPGPRPLVRIEAGENLGAMTAAGGDVWVNDFGTERLLRVDGHDGRVLERLPLGRRLALAADRDAVWALRWGGRFFRTPNGPLYRIDAATGRITRRIPLDPGQIYFGVIAGGGDVWVWGPRHLVRIDPSSGFITAEFDAAEEAGELTGAVRAPGGLLASTARGRLLRITRAGVLPGPRSDALARSELLAVDRGRALASVAGALVAVDVETGRLLWRRPLGFRISTMLPREGILLAHGAAFRDAGDRVWAIDTATGRVLGAAVVPSFGTTSMALAGGALWFATSAGELIAAPPLTVRLFLARARAA